MKTAPLINSNPSIAHVAPRMNVSRQTHLAAAIMLITAFALYLWVAPGWIFLALLPTFGLSLDALTGVCPMTLILKRMPWNRGVAR